MESHPLRYALIVSEESFSIDAYDYDLPRERIAQEPLAERSASRLMVLDRLTGAVSHRVFADLPDVLAAGDLLVINRTRVVPARLLGRRPGGGAAEILLVRRRGQNEWDAMVRPGRRLRAGSVVEVAADFRVHIRGIPGPLDELPAPPLRRVRLETPDADPATAVERHGHVPLPPYIARPDRPTDKERYQTVYASEAGSVAAPTAGLHFTSDLLGALRARGVEVADITLHVGPGTFRPVQVRDVRDHRVEPEPFLVTPETASALSRAHAADRRVVAVGTTSTRVLESVLGPDGCVHPGEGETSLVITPGHTFRAVGALVTNFHLPRSSLLLLVCAFGGRARVLAAYEEAVRQGYRFYSYGDAMLLL